MTNNPKAMSDKFKWKITTTDESGNIENLVGHYTKIEYAEENKADLDMRAEAFRFEISNEEGAYAGKAYLIMHEISGVRYGWTSKGWVIVEAHLKEE